MRKLITAALAIGALMAAIVPANAAKQVTVIEDPAGDADNNQGAGASVPGGFDIVSGTIVKKGANLEFSVKHADMPASGTLPEGFRFLWQFSVDGEEYRFTVKSADIGKPDVIAGDGQDRVGQVYQGLFRLEQCTEEAAPAVLTLVNCRASEFFEGSFDPAEASMTWTVPMKAIKAKTGSTIVGGSAGAASTSCQICWVPHYAERSLTPATVIDSAVQTIGYKVPKK